MKIEIEVEDEDIGGEITSNLSIIVQLKILREQLKYYDCFYVRSVIRISNQNVTTQETVIDYFNVSDLDGDYKVIQHSYAADIKDDTKLSGNAVIWAYNLENGK